MRFQVDKQQNNLYTNHLCITVDGLHVILHVTDVVLHVQAVIANVYAKSTKGSLGRCRGNG